MMSFVEGVVKEKNEKMSKSGKVYLQLVVNGLKFNDWNGVSQGINIGDSVRIGFEVVDNFKNLKSIEVLSGVSVEEEFVGGSEENSFVGGDDWKSSKDLEIFRGQCFNAAVSFLSQDPKTIDMSEDDWCSVVFNLASKLFEVGKERGFLNWR